ncbi:MAG: hypothetical protein ACLP7O_03820 [Terracidiphilus sp.]
MKQLALDLVAHPKGDIEDTFTQIGWTSKNIRLLDEFFRPRGLDCSFHGSDQGGEFLWDFIGYIKRRGILIAAESEYLTNLSEIERDFDKLLYSSSPIKLMICRIDTKYRVEEEARKEAERIQSALQKHIAENCAHYPPGSVFILYCVWWANEGTNRDFPFILQIDGEPCYEGANNRRFEPA